MVLENRNTIDQLVSFETFIRDAFVNKEHAVYGRGLFRKKTYDTTWKYGILKDLHDIRLKGHLLNKHSSFYIVHFLCQNLCTGTKFFVLVTLAIL